MEDIKSRDRVKDFGEVFTPPHIINQMLDTLPPEMFQPQKTFLEPTCGDGRMIIEVLKRKFANCKKRKEYTECLKSIWGMELQADNVKACIQNIISLCKAHFDPTKSEILLIESHIIQADSWKVMKLLEEYHE